MKKPNRSFVLAVLFSGAFLAVLLVLGGLGGFILGSQPSLRQFSSVARYAGLLGNNPAFNQGNLRLLSTLSRFAGWVAALGFIVTAAVIALRAALQPGSWGRKALAVLPAFFLGVLLAGIALNVVGIGVNGSFALDWLMVSALLALVAIVLAAAWVVLDRASVRLATAALGVTGVFTLLAWLGTIVGVVSFLLNPTAGRGGPGGGGGGGGGAGPRPGGPGGANGLIQPLLIASGLLTILGVVAWIAIVRAWRNSRQPAAAPGAAAPGAADATVATPAAAINASGELGRAVVSLAAVTLIVFAAIQIVPVSKTNAPVVTPVTWDNPQDQALFTGACADCHSNETVRPWYDYVAPSSWLLSSHINGAQGWWNISELNQLSPDAKKFLPDQIGQALHNNIMPPHDYQFMHPSARLSDAQKEELIAALKTVISK